MEILEHISAVVRQIELAEYILIAVNLAAGFGCAVPIAKLLGKDTSGNKRFLRYFAIAICVYWALFSDSGCVGVGRHAG
jgi:hypothetical protein